MGRYEFLVSFAKHHPLAVGQSGAKEMRELKRATTGCASNEAEKLVLNDIRNCAVTRTAFDAYINGEEVSR